MSISREREAAIATYTADWQTIGSHVSTSVPDDGMWLARPETATHLQIQALAQNVRYTVDNSQATASFGFQLAAGDIATVPVPGLGVSVHGEASGATLEYQWLR